MHVYGGMGLDVDAMRRDWRRASASQKVVRVGIVGGFLGILVHALATAPKSGPRPAWCTMPPEPVERDPNAPPHTAPGARPAPTGRGHYR